MSIQQDAIRAIEAQQAKEKPRSPQWMVGEQLKDICRREPQSAELIAQDLENPSMSITEAEKKIKAFADKHKTGNFSCVTPDEAVRILRKFYGLGSGASATPPDRSLTPEAAMTGPRTAPVCACPAGLCESGRFSVRRRALWNRSTTSS